MTDPPSKFCTRCGSVISADTAGGLCPRCLMAMNFDSRTMPEGEEPPQAPSLTPEELAEKFPQYEILECLGRGGMGVVYKARQKSLDRIVAIKILPPERVGEERFSERFAKEASTLARLSHPNIVTVHDFGETGGLFYIVMEYVDGVNLRDLLREGKLEPKQALAIVPPICDALQYAHDKGIVHRDIKPENLLLDRDGRIKIADFGIAKLIEPVAAVCDRRTSEDINQRRTHSAATLHAGTPDYAAPEQSSGSADHRTDIFALGVVLYEMLTGERPNKEIVAPSQKVNIDVRLDEIVLRALEKKPELRYQTAGEFRTVVQTLAATPPPAHVEPIRRKKRRKKIIFRLLDPLPTKNKLLRTALTLMLAGLTLIALIEGAWSKGGEMIDQTINLNHYPEYHSLRVIIPIVCISISAFILWRIILWLTANRSTEGEVYHAKTASDHSPRIMTTQAELDALATHPSHWYGYFFYACRQDPRIVVPKRIAGLGWTINFANPWALPFTAALIVGTLAAIQLTEMAGFTTNADKKWVFVILLLAIVWICHRMSRAPIVGSNYPTRLIKTSIIGTLIFSVALSYFGPGKHVPVSSMSAAYTAPVIGRIEFQCSHAEAVAGGSSGSAFGVKAWGDTQWRPFSGHGIGLEGGRTILFKTRVDACRFTPPMAMVTASLNGKDWETRRIQLRAVPCVQSLDFTNGLKVTIHWSPTEVPGLNSKSPDPTQQDVMRRGSERADQEHPLTDVSGSQAFGPVIERVVNEMESALGNEALRLESGELFSVPKNNTNGWLGETSANLLVGRTGAEIQLILHNGILRDMNNAEWDHATPETFRRAMEKGPGMMKPGKSESHWAAYDWTGGEVPVTFGFDLASRARGMLQVLGDTPDGSGLKIRYKLLPGPNGETILPPDFEFVRDRATEIAGRYYPDLKIRMDDDRFIMQRNLREFDVHNASKSGDVSAETHKETGPAADGFLLVLEPIVEAPVSQAFQADGKQILDRPYWKSFVDHRFDPAKRSGVAMFFDFGTALKTEFKDEMLSLLEMKPQAEKPETGADDEKERQALKTITTINNTNQFLDLELAVTDAKAGGMGDNHPTVIVAADELARFKETHPDTSEAVWRQLVGQRLEKANEDLAALHRNGLGKVHPTVVMQQARIRVLTEMLGKPFSPNEQAPNAPKPEAESP